MPGRAAQNMYLPSARNYKKKAESSSCSLRTSNLIEEMGPHTHIIKLLRRWGKAARSFPRVKWVASLGLFHSLSLSSKMSSSGPEFLGGVGAHAETSWQLGTEGTIYSKKERRNRCLHSALRRGPVHRSRSYSAAYSLKARFTFVVLNTDGEVLKLGFLSDYRNPPTHQLHPFHSLLWCIGTFL